MAWIAIDNDGQEVLFASCPRFNEDEGAWIADDGRVVELTKGSIERLIGHDLMENRIMRI